MDEYITLLWVQHVILIFFSFSFLNFHHKQCVDPENVNAEKGVYATTIGKVKKMAGLKEQNKNLLLRAMAI